MLTFDELLGRATEPALQDLIGRETLRLLVRVDPQVTQPERLRKVVTDLRDPADLLMEPRSRAVLLDLLPIDEAKLLAARLRLPGDEPFQELLTAKYPRNSRRATELLDFFCVAEPEGQDSEQPFASTELIAADRPLFHSGYRRCLLRRHISLM